MRKKEARATSSGAGKELMILRAAVALRGKVISADERERARPGCAIFAGGGRVRPPGSWRADSAEPTHPSGSATLRSRCGRSPPPGWSRRVRAGMCASGRLALPAMVSGGSARSCGWCRRRSGARVGVARPGPGPPRQPGSCLVQQSRGQVMGAETGTGHQRPARRWPA